MRLASFALTRAPYSRLASAARRLYSAALSRSLENQWPGRKACRGGWINVALAKAMAHKETKMPKLKTKSGVKKRFKLTATGKIKMGVAGKRHRLISHNAKYIRQNRGTEILADADTARVKAWAPYGLK
jgi:large subunit ribosomal protein L35